MFLWGLNKLLLRKRKLENQFKSIEINNNHQMQFNSNSYLKSNSQIVVWFQEKSNLNLPM